LFKALKLLLEGSFTALEHIVYDSQDIEENKVIAALSYLGILVLVPLLVKKESPYCQFHAKQGLVLLIAWVIVGFVAVIPILGWIVSIFGSLFLFVLFILGIVNALGGQAKELPVIGQFGDKLNL
jgi:uncharacterized membrane protein